MLTRWLASLLKLDDVQSIDGVEWSLAAGWVRTNAAPLLWSCAGLMTLAVLFYWRWQPRRSPRIRWMLALSRGLLYALLLLLLAEPTLTVRMTHQPHPWLWLLFDGTESMAIADEYPTVEREALDRATGRGTSSSSAGGRPSRMDYLQALLRKPDENLLQSLTEKYRLKGFQLQRADGARELTPAGSSDPPPGPTWSQELATAGQVTALGRALEELALRRPPGHLAGVLVFSDFDQNSGPPAVAAAQRLGVPVSTVAIGAQVATDLAIDLQVPLLLKKAERATLLATVRSSDVAGRSASVRVTAQRLADDESAGAVAQELIVVGERTISLDSAEQPVEFNWVPSDTGRYLLAAEASPFPDELVTDNNRAEREIDVRDDFLRLLFVEYEPTWEWRFIKEVFHRDKLVGQRGFRTYLRSADPRVRQSNELFLSQLTPRRSEFFANDVIFLGDVPSAALSPRFCEMAQEFVGKFGGGLVVLSGPRFGPGQLASTPLAEMLPVVVDPSARPQGGAGFKLRLTPEAVAYDFMQLGGDDREHLDAWHNLGTLPWYQPVSRLHPLATALAVHPTQTCTDGKTPQPLIAVRRYGKGEVIYLAFNETWRLRRKYGEVYFRQFWGQMIHRLGLSHALGSRKRFVVRTDRQQYQPDDKVLLTIEAFDANFEPLAEDDLPDRVLTAEWMGPAAADGRQPEQTLKVPQSREGVFETSFAPLTSGEHRLSVVDPVTGDRADVLFQVASVSVERRSAVRNSSLADELAQSTGGRSYDLTTVGTFVDDFQPRLPVEKSVRVISLWDTWLSFVVVVFLMLWEWMIRKLVHLT